MRVLVTGGGTGGHIYPALAVAQSILKKYPSGEVLYIGTDKGLENKIVPQANIPFQTIDVEGLQRKFSVRGIKTIFKALKGTGEALKIVKKFGPQVVIGTGGYVCGPVVLAARMLKIPTIIHEQNALPGITNRMLARFVDKILITFPESSKHFANKEKIIITGLPIREEIFGITKEEGYLNFNFNPKKKTLLVTGGSRGAQSINWAMIEAYPELIKRKDLQIIHITGQFGYEDIISRLEGKGINLEKYGNIILRPYLHQMEYALAIADLYVARAGATFLAEVTAKGIPGVLVPYPYAAENHQEFNARALVDQEAAIMILDKDMNGTKLYTEIINMIDNPHKLKEMGKNSKKAGNTESLAKIIEVIEELAN